MLSICIIILRSNRSLFSSSLWRFIVSLRVELQNTEVLLLNLQVNHKIGFKVGRRRLDLGARSAVRLGWTKLIMHYQRIYPQLISMEVSAVPCLLMEITQSVLKEKFPKSGYFGGWRGGPDDKNIQ